MYTGIIEHYREYLPLAADVQPVSLCEGNTPLIKLRNLPKQLGIDVEIYVKYEGLNPTASFKDRGMTVAISQAVAEGCEAVVCASTGNTSAAAAAYAARAGITAFVIIPEGKIALGKMAQALMHGAKVIQIRGDFDAGMQMVKSLGKELPLAIVNSINPYRIEGQKTAAFEIVDVLKRAPDYHCLPVGNAGNITAYWRGYCEYHEKGIAKNKPVMCGYQAAGAAPFIAGEPIKNAETVATAIRIGNPQSWDGACEAQQSSSGWFSAFSDEVILQTQKLLAQSEGIFCEPASAVSIAGALADCQSGQISSGSTIVCTLTGHGLKDPDIAISQAQLPDNVVDADLAAVRAVVSKELA